MKDRVRALSSELGNVNFSYQDPVKNFDRSKVKGVVARLIKIKDSSTATALEVCFSKLLIFVLKWIFPFIEGTGLAASVELLVILCRLLLEVGYIMWLLTQKTQESSSYKMEGSEGG